MPEEPERGAQDAALEVRVPGRSQRGPERIWQDERAGRIDPPGALSRFHSSETERHTVEIPRSSAMPAIRPIV